MKRKFKKAVFFDRDGIINQTIIYKKIVRSPRSIKEFKINYKIKKYLRFFRNNFFFNIIVTNQPEVRRGLVKKMIVNYFHKKIKNKLPIDKIYVCYDTNNKSFFRKPNPGMLLRASKEFKVRLKDSYLIGDRCKDIHAGNRVKCKTVFIDYNYNEKKPKKFFITSNSLLKGLELIKKDIIKNSKFIIKKN